MEFPKNAHEVTNNLNLYMELAAAAATGSEGDGEGAVSASCWPSACEYRMVKAQIFPAILFQMMGIHMAVEMRGAKSVWKEKIYGRKENTFWNAMDGRNFSPQMSDSRIKNATSWVKKFNARGQTL